MEIIEVYYDDQATWGGRQVGAWRARLAGNHGIHDAGGTEREAVARLIVTAASHNYSADPASYQAVRIDRQQHTIRRHACP